MMRILRCRKSKFVILLLGSVFFSGGCSDDTSGAENIPAARLLPVFSFPKESGIEYGAWQPFLCWFDETGCFAVQEAASLTELPPQKVKEGMPYTAVALVADHVGNLIFQPGLEPGVTRVTDWVQIADLSAEIPRIFLAHSSGEAGAGEMSVPFSFQRAFARMTVRLDVPDGTVESVKIWVEGLYDRLKLDGKTYGCSKENFISKRFELESVEPGVFSNSGGTTLMPADTTSESLSLVFQVSFADGSGKSYRVRCPGTLRAGESVHVSAELRDKRSGIQHLDYSRSTWSESEIGDRPDYRNSRYSVKIQREPGGEWVALNVHPALVSDYGKKMANESDFKGSVRDTMAFSLFTHSFDTPVRVRVTKRNAPFQTVQVRPLSYGILPEIQDAYTVEFELTDPKQKVSVEFDGDRQHNLFLFPDLPDTDKPDPDDPNVRYFGPGEHIVPGGVIKLGRDEMLYLDEGAIVYAIVRNKSEGAPGASIRGRGILCGSKSPHGSGERTQLISFDGSDDVTISGVVLRDSPHWTIRLYYSSRAVVDNVKQICWISNSDGVDICCSWDVTVSNCFFRNYDDNISIKNFWWGGWSLRNITVRDNVFWADAAHNMLVGPEGGAGRTTDNVLFENNIVLENREAFYIYTGVLGVMGADRGTFTNITFRNIEIEDIRGGRLMAFDFVPYDYNTPDVTSDADYYGTLIGNVTLENISYTGTDYQRGSIGGYSEERCVDGIVISNFVCNGMKVMDGTGPYLEVKEHVKNIEFR